MDSWEEWSCTIPEISYRFPFFGPKEARFGVASEYSNNMLKKLYQNLDQVKC